nr:aspartyl protease family protein At5g10770-like [Ipomoea batatas]
MQWLTPTEDESSPPHTAAFCLLRTVMAHRRAMSLPHTTGREGYRCRHPVRRRGKKPRIVETVIATDCSSASSACSASSSRNRGEERHNRLAVAVLLSPEEHGIFVTMNWYTPKTISLLLVDTGTTALGLGCKTCSNRLCGPKDHLFDPSKSSTYVNGSCRPSKLTEMMVNLSSLTGTSKSNGYWGCDTLTDQSYYATSRFPVRLRAKRNNPRDDGYSSGDYAGIIGSDEGIVPLPSSRRYNFQKFRGFDVEVEAVPGMSSSRRLSQTWFVWEFAQQKEWLANYWTSAATNAMSFRFAGNSLGFGT